ncbi:DUF805 domain-containing protein [Deinococcus radiomollis]|uniref:DUF805 domain-containing protein n=1 Tax=Deinococcus radiomollis TaxID=468916 RepID=UPI003891C6E0
MNEYLHVVRDNYANFSGRARRREFWMFTLINALVLVALLILLLIGLATGDRASINALSIISIALIVIYSLATLVPSLAVSVRRLHDAGYTGWLELLEFVGLRIVIMIFHIMDSQPGSNKWGPNPKGIQAPVNAF